MVIGALDRVEIWDPTNWETYLASEEEQFADLSDEIFPGV